MTHYHFDGGAMERHIERRRQERADDLTGPRKLQTEVVLDALDAFDRKMIVAMNSGLTKKQGAEVAIELCVSIIHIVGMSLANNDDERGEAIKAELLKNIIFHVATNSPTHDVLNGERGGSA